MTSVFVNRIATAVPPHEVHGVFVRFARSLLAAEPRSATLFERMAQRAGIERRYSCLAPSDDPAGAAVDRDGLFTRGRFAGTARRMAAFEREAPALAAAAVAALELGPARRRISHVIVTTCTGLSAPGIDLALVERCGLDPAVERTVVGFMGCFAAINGLRLARHIVRSDPAALVLMVNVELCTLHLHETGALDEMLSYLLFGDGCAASLVSAAPEGVALDGFRTVLIPGSRDLITWRVSDQGFDMMLSGQVPAAIREGVRAAGDGILAGAPPDAVELWAVHPGGRSVLDAVEQGFDLKPAALAAAREVLRCYGNMSSPSVMFVLEALMRGGRAGAAGVALSFGPGLTAETMRFHLAG